MSVTAEDDKLVASVFQKMLVNDIGLIRNKIDKGKIILLHEDLLMLIGHFNGGRDVVIETEFVPGKSGCGCCGKATAKLYEEVVSITGLTEEAKQKCKHYDISLERVLPNKILEMNS